MGPETISAPDLLREAADVIDQRAVGRDLPAERAMRRTVGAFNTLTGQTLTETQGWLFMAVLKLARASAGAFQRDDLLDGAAYMALALEAEIDHASQTAVQPVGDTQGSGGTLTAGGVEKSLWEALEGCGGVNAAHQP